VEPDDGGETVTLTSDQITTIRRQYIRDLYTPADGVNPAEALSFYNRATKAEFISDADLQAKADFISRDYGDELSGVYVTAYNHQIAGGASTVDADVTATAVQNDAFYRLIRASVFEDMMLDPGFQGSIADEKQRAGLIKTWQTQILQDREFASERTTAALGSLPIVRY
jgi:hypothetical protein